MSSLYQFACLVALVVASSMARAEPRIALIIGNSSYGSVTSLDNPANDARLIGEKLRKLGFDVTEAVDSNQVVMKRAIAQFGRDLRAAGEDATGLFYFAGHGVQSFGSNYLLPVDIELSDAADLDLLAVQARSVLHQMASARNKTNIVILDACRNNPFEELPSLDDNGLAEMKAPTGTFLAYATDPGGVALDGETGNSPFTLSLANNIDMPGLPIEQLFKQVRVEVLEQTRGLQTPWDTSSLVKEFAFAGPKQSKEELESETAAWNVVSNSRNVVEIMLYLKAYPEGHFTSEARDLMQIVMAESFLSSEPEQSQKPVKQEEKKPSQIEQLMFDLAVSNQSRHGYQTYLEAFPEGAFVEDAQQQIAALDLEATSVARSTNVQSAAVSSSAPDLLTLDTPLTVGNGHIRGNSITDLIASAPQFPPIEGLPDELWKDEPCASCHEWTAETLCEQAQTYIRRPAAGNLVKSHPFGGGFKLSLHRWAKDGCLP